MWKARACVLPTQPAHIRYNSWNSKSWLTIASCASWEKTTIVTLGIKQYSWYRRWEHALTVTVSWNTKGATSVSRLYSRSMWTVSWLNGVDEQQYDMHDKWGKKNCACLNVILWWASYPDIQSSVREVSIHSWPLRHSCIPGNWDYYMLVNTSSSLLYWHKIEACHSQANTETYRWSLWVIH